MQPIRKFKLIKPYPNTIHTMGDIVISTCNEDDKFYSIWPEFWQPVYNETEKRKCLFCKTESVPEKYVVCYNCQKAIATLFKTNA